MIREAATVPAGSLIERDVCVVGAGAAGITLARELARLGQRVCLLESGGEALQTATQDLYRGAAPAGGLIAQEDYLWSSRVRFLGGSTNHWQGECERLAASELAARDWVPHSGWPFAEATLAPWYARAAELLEIDTAKPPLPFPVEGLAPEPAHTSPPVRFGPRYRDELAGSERILLLLRANAVELTLNESGTALAHTQVATLAGSRFRVAAKHTVLAAGALENARLLLAAPGAPGNAHDQVGRYFMDTLYGTGAAHLLLLRPLTQPVVVRLDEAAERRDALLAMRFRLTPQASQPTGLLAQLAALAEDVAQAAGEPAGRTGAQPGVARVDVGLEVAPDPANRVTLGSERDALGVPRLALWAAPGELERASLQSGLEHLAAAFSATLEARAEIAEDPWSRLEPGQHPSGTTRMHEDPRQGVVDESCRVHGVANLHVAGSSVFPTAGRARPTWTLLALALRLADHLAGPS